MSNETALTKIEKAQQANALMYVDTASFEKESEYTRQDISLIPFTEDDFHTIDGKMVPKRATTDRIAEAKGIEFIESSCRVENVNTDDLIAGKRTVYRAYAQGKIRLPDGTWRHSTLEVYDFDPILNALIDKNCNTPDDLKKPEVYKVARQNAKVASRRAATGVRQRVIKQLTGMPTGFEKKDISRPMCFDRFILTKEGYEAEKSGSKEIDPGALWGTKKLLPTTYEANIVTETPEQEPENRSNAADLANQANSEEPEFPDEPTAPAKEHEDLLREKTLILEQIMLSHKDVLDKTSESGKNPYKIAQNELDNPNATIESRSSMTDRLRTWLQAKGYKV